MAKKETNEEMQLAQEGKLKALQAAMAKIEKDFGKGSIMKLGDQNIENVEVIPTGSITLDIALGVGGYPKGRIIEIYGPESSGKTTLAIHAIAEAQKQGGIAAFIDAEHAFDRFYAAKLGVDVDNLWISQPDNGEQALQIADQLISSAAVDIVVIDSVAALTPKSEIEGSMGDNKVGLQARLMSQALRKLTATISKTNTTCIFINQLREKIGVMFGNPETTTGGNALKFYASVRLDIRKGSAIKDGDTVIGGYPKGRIIEIYGPESSGKTTLAIHAIAEAQKQGGIAAFIDAEHAFDRFYAAKLGVDVDNLWISQPDNGEQALQIADQLISSAAVDIVVIDSVAALTPKSEIEGSMGDNKVGLQARLMSQALRKLTATISKTNTTCIFINQLREKIGVMFGNPETTTGGNALKFYASVRLDIRKGSAIKDGDTVIGNETRVKIVKNKVAPPFRKAEFEIMFGEGISKTGEILDLGVEYDIIQKSGSWFSYNGAKLAQGRDATKALLRDNPELCDELEALIKQAIEEKKD